MKLRRWTALLTAILCLCLPLTQALAAADGADKNAIGSTEEPGKYSIILNVPGLENNKRHDEIIIMVDGSTSVDNEWPHMKAGILEIAKLALNNKNDVRLTLMAFGMAPTTVAEHIKSVSELESILNTYQGNLLYGRSSTNIEGAMIGIQRYLKEHDTDSLKDACVVFLTDGGVNQHAGLNKWQMLAKSYSNTNDYETLLLAECQAVLANAAVLSEETKAVFTEAEIEQLMEAARANNTAAIRNLAAQTNSEGVTKGLAWMNLVIANIYAHHGMSDENGGYSICDMERATLDYQNAKGSYIENTFYYLAMRKGSISGGEVNNQKRAIEAAQALATDSAFHVDSLYLLQYGSDNRAEWMQFKDHSGKQYTAPANAFHVSAGSISNLAETIRQKLAALAETPFNDVSVQDYTSKWVTLQPETICILDADDRVIAAYDPAASDPAAEQYAYRWLISSPPFTDRAPIELELVQPEDYPDDPAIQGNRSGKIYRITWNVKAGTLLRTDGYHMKYDILIDTKEKDFSYSVNYPANGDTVIRYKDKLGNPKEDPIPVPDVILIDEGAPIPETGDGNRPLLWTALLLTSLVGLALTARRRAHN